MYGYMNPGTNNGTAAVNSMNIQGEDQKKLVYKYNIRLTYIHTHTYIASVISYPDNIFCI